jgi:hypothetical protein
MEHIDASNWFNLAGLAADIVGVYFIWTFGLPERISRTGEGSILLEGVDPAEKAKAERYDLWARRGISFIIGGFVLQIVGNLL